MAKIIFDDIRDKFITSGVSKCVFEVDGKVYPWNGVISIDENRADTEGTLIHIDGAISNYIPQKAQKSYSVRCFTYPDQLYKCLGFQKTSGGAILESDKTFPCNIAWETLLYNELGDPVPQYHILYNVYLSIGSTSYGTVSSQVDATVFEFSAISLPTQMRGFAPQQKIVLDARSAKPEAIDILRANLYGTDRTTPKFPNTDFILRIFSDLATFSVGSETIAGLYSMVSGDQIGGSTVSGLFVIKNPEAIVESPSIGVYTKV